MSGKKLKTGYHGLCSCHRGPGHMGVHRIGNDWECDDYYRIRTTIVEPHHDYMQLLQSSPEEGEVWDYNHWYWECVIKPRLARRHR